MAKHFGTNAKVFDMWPSGELTAGDLLARQSLRDAGNGPEPVRAPVPGWELAGLDSGLTLKELARAMEAIRKVTGQAPPMGGQAKKEPAAPERRAISLGGVPRSKGGANEE